MKYRLEEKDSVITFIEHSLGRWELYPTNNKLLKKPNQIIYTGMEGDEIHINDGGISNDRVIIVGNNYLLLAYFCDHKITHRELLEEVRKVKLYYNI